MNDIFEWDSEKAETNLTKYGVSFEEATSVFLRSAFLDDFRFSTF